MTSSIFVSVVRCWRFANDDGSTFCVETPRQRNATLRKLHGDRTARGSFDLPWPPFPSNYWRHALGRDTQYRSTPIDVLVRTLLPLRARPDVTIDVPLSVREPLAEVYDEPFGVWTCVTIDLTKQWDDPRSVADDIVEAMDMPIILLGEALGMVKDGIDPRTVVQHIDPDRWRVVPQWVYQGTTTIISGLCNSSADVKVEAPQFRSGFRGGGAGTVHLLSRSKGASSTTSGQIGLALADTSKKSPTFVKCLHHNHALLAGHLMSFSSIVSPDISVGVEKYQAWGIRYLNHLHRGVALPDAGIYRSRVAQAWLEHQNLISTIDAMKSRFYSDEEVPPLATGTSSGKKGGDDGG